MHWENRQYGSFGHLAAAYRRGERPRLHFRRHFAERMQQMGVTEDELFDAIANPDQVGTSEKHGAVLLFSDRITVSVQLDAEGYPDAGTLLWRFREDWEDAYASGTAGSGRARRDLSHLPSRDAS